MKNTLTILTVFATTIFLSSCRQVYNTVVNEEHGTYGVHTITKFEYLGTMGLIQSPNVLFADMVKAAKEKYGEGITITNIRSRINYQSFFGLTFGFQEEVLFDVYVKK
jgi:hypothetical protein